MIAFSRSIGPVPLDCVLTEEHESSIAVTTNPIEIGADVTDHAYLLPNKVSLQIADRNGTATFAALKRFQESRVPFTLVTGFMVYNNMMILTLSASRSADYSRVLNGRCEIQEVIIVDTSTAASEGGIDGGSTGKPGGDLSLRSATPVSSRAGDPVTIDRAAGILQRGDMPARSVPALDAAAILRSVFQ